MHLPLSQLRLTLEHINMSKNTADSTLKSKKRQLFLLLSPMLDQYNLVYQYHCKI